MPHLESDSTSDQQVLLGTEETSPAPPLLDHSDEPLHIGVTILDIVIKAPPGETNSNLIHEEISELLELKAIEEVARNLC